MREIKFRCWVPIHKRFYYWGIGVDGAEFTGPPSGRMSARQLDHQQFTGFRDKNGHEIYEGDILASIDIYGKFIGFVKWWNDRWTVCYKVKQTNEPQHQSLMTVGKIAIVGNVHEAPELLAIKEATQ